MDIPIQYPWYRRAFPPRVSDLSMGEPLSDWPLCGPSPGLSLGSGRHSCAGATGLKTDTQMRLEKDRFVIYLDVKHFSPDELSVNVSEDYITVHAKHEDRQDDHGFVSREFFRKYRLPAGVSNADVTSSLSSDGILTITTPRSATAPERNIPISCDEKTGKPKI
uniref:Alpha-crystallin B chain n=1 Tax=Neogobius melanostomus TaxID=47308 RepID=A0A8C6S738_9GOBI